MGNCLHKKRNLNYTSIPMESIQLCPPQTENPPNYLSVLKKDTNNIFNMKLGPLIYSYKLQYNDLRANPKQSSSIVIATWNLQEMDDNKISNPGVLETVCLLILRKGIDILTLQEIGSENVLKIICDQLNLPTLPKVKAFFLANKYSLPRTQFCFSYVCHVVGRMYRGNELSAVIYKDCKVLASSVLKFRKDKKPMVRFPFLTVMELSTGFRFVLISVHLKPSEAKHETAKIASTMNLIKKIILKSGGEWSKNIMVAGDFNLAPDNPEFSELISNGFFNLVDASTYTNISVRNPNGSFCYDNIWISRSLKDCVVGCVVERNNLTHPLIPDLWKWGGTVSDHCPVIATAKLLG